MAPTPPSPTPSTSTAPLPGVQRLHLDREKQLDVTWADGTCSVFTLGYLRAHCPCASCKKFREEQASRKTLLTILPGNYSGAIRAQNAEMVGNYALRIDWSDGHSSGIYSFEYLWGIRPA